jgi:hypothetical protein
MPVQRTVGVYNMLLLYLLYLLLKIISCVFNQ